MKKDVMKKNAMFRDILCGLVLSGMAFLLPGAVVADEHGHQEDSETAHEAGGYGINPGDTLGIFVWNEAELTREALVRPDGFISFPMIGDVKVGGKSASAVQEEMAERLHKFLQDKPVITISLRSIQGNQIYVLGKVARPGVFPMGGPTDVMQALALAGGVTTFAAGNRIKVLRRDENGNQQAIRFKYSDVKDGDKLESNILLKSGDVVVVP